MILRRVIEHVKAQNWTAVVLDFVIVVVGVFIGIQVSNWNEKRQQQNLEIYYLERLHEEILRSRDDAADTLKFVEHSGEEATFILQALESCMLPPTDRDRFASALYLLGKLSQPILIDTTLEEMKATGRLVVLTNRELIKSLLELQFQYHLDARAFQQIATWTNDQVAEIHSRVIFAITSPIGGSASFTWDQISFDFDTACRDSRFKAAVGSIRNYTYEAVIRAKESRSRLDSALQPLEAELNKRVSGRKIAQ